MRGPSVMVTTVDGVTRQAPLRTVRLHAPVWTRSAWGQAALALLLSRVVAWGFGLASAHGHITAVFQQWDALHYLQLANHGYPSTGDLENWAFFPLFPLLGRTLFIGVLISTVAYWLALGLIHVLTEEAVDRHAARRAVWIAALFPTSFFFTGYYTEGLFLLLSSGAVLAVQRRRTATAASLGFLAALCRPTGIALIVPMFLLGRGRSLRSWLAVTFAPLLGLLSYMAFSLAVTGSATTPMIVERTWGRAFRGPFTAIGPAAHDAYTWITGGTNATWGFEAGWIRALQFALLLLTIVIVIGLLRRFTLAYGLFVVASLAGPLSDYWPQHSLVSYIRYVASLFPIYIWLGARIRGRALPPILLLESIGLALFSYRFAGGMWAG